MALLNLFSKRQRAIRGEVPDVYRFDEIPAQLRVQVVHIIQDALGDDHWAADSRSKQAYAHLHQMLARELGVFLLADRNDPKDNLFQFILQEPDVEKVLDAIELTFGIIASLGNDSGYTYYTKPRQGPDEAIAELNARFREHGIGYQFEAGRVVKADSEYLHSEVIKPALTILADKRYAGAQKEFLAAHQHYRKGENEQAISEALKAFESTMKSICTKRKWIYKDTDTAKQLLDVELTRFRGHFTL